MGQERIVYVVDDDADIRRSLALSLKEAEYLPRPFVCGKDFIDALDYIEDGCVLLDMHMPDATGLDVLEHLKACGRNMPVLMITGDGDIPLAVKSIRSGAIDFIEKPFREAQMLDALERAFVELDRMASRQHQRRKAKGAIDLLTRRERDVFIGMVTGQSNKRIALDIDLSVRTVEMHRRNLMRKLAIRSTAEALQLAVDAGIDIQETVLNAQRNAA